MAVDAGRQRLRRRLLGGDCLTVKYSADGKELWAQRYAGPEGSVTIRPEVAVDAAGNIHVNRRHRVRFSENQTTPGLRDDQVLSRWAGDVGPAPSMDPRASATPDRASPIDMDGNVCVNRQVNPY